MLLNEYPHINDPPKQVPCNYVECVSAFGTDAGGRNGKGVVGCSDVIARGGCGY